MEIVLLFAAFIVRQHMHRQHIAFFFLYSFHLLPFSFGLCTRVILKLLTSGAESKKSSRLPLTQRRDAAARDVRNFIESFSVWRRISPKALKATHVHKRTLAHTYTDSIVTSKTSVFFQSIQSKHFVPVVRGRTRLLHTVFMNQSMRQLWKLNMNKWACFFSFFLDSSLNHVRR